jgi:hypothetical protein
LASVKRHPSDLLALPVGKPSQVPVGGQSKEQSPVLLELKCPIFSSVRVVLQRGGYAFSTFYCRPCGAAFPTAEQLRSDLCAYGVSCRCDYKSNGCEGFPCLCWDDGDKLLIHKWVRYNVIRGPRQSGIVFQLNRTKALHYIKRLGFGCARSSEYERKGWGYPGAKDEADENGMDGVNTFFSWDGLMLSLCRFGLPESCEFGNLSHDERLSLELYIANYFSVANTL